MSDTVVPADTATHKAWHTSTLAAHEIGDAVHGSVVFPIFQSATFAHDACADEALPGHSVIYTRCNTNPSQLAVSSKLAALHGAEAALVTNSGMSAITSTLLALLQSGDHLLVQPCLYGGTFAFCFEMLPKLGIQVTELTEGHPADWDSLVQPGKTKVVYVETASNPLCSVMDLPAVVRLAQQHGLISVVDNTFASPVNLRPLQLNMDIVIESATKFLNGHSDVIAGMVAGSTPLIAKVTRHVTYLGGCLDPHACFLLNRGIKTLWLRVRQANTNAMALAQALHQHPAVLRVHYSGLPTHSQHALATRLFLGPTSDPGQNGSDDCKSAAAADGRGYGGMLAFELRGGKAAAEQCLRRLKVAQVAPSLGGVETLVTRPAATSHADQTPEQRAATGITDGLIRVAVGVEHPEDLVADFLQACEGL